MQFPPFKLPDKKHLYVAHYTDVNNLCSILKPENVALWATRYGFFEDELEYTWPFDEIKKHIQQIAEDLKVDYDNDRATYPYILSFSNTLDSEFMWEEYTPENRGIMLLFDKDKLYDYCNKFIEETGQTRYCMDVLYASDTTIHEVLAQAYNSLQEAFPTVDLIDPLYDMPAFVKNKVPFERENEFRLTHCCYEIYHATPDNIDNLSPEEGSPLGLKFREFNGKKIPYIEILIPKDILVGIVLGGKSNTDENVNLISTLISEGGYNVDIWQS